MQVLQPRGRVQHCRNWLHNASGHASDVQDVVWVRRRSWGCDRSFEGVQQGDIKNKLNAACAHTCVHDQAWVPWVLGEGVVEELEEVWWQLGGLHVWDFAAYCEGRGLHGSWRW